MTINRKNVPIFIISKNRLTCLRQLIAWLEKGGYRRIIVLDNNSNYDPLLHYLDNLNYEVHRFQKDQGHLVLWKCGLFDQIVDAQEYALSDPDIVPTEDCPSDAIEHFSRILELFPNIVKVGFSLKLNDIPDCNPLRKTVIEWESQFFRSKVSGYEFDLYEAPIDTTFALYRPGIRPGIPEWWKAIRTGAPYEARHTSWYLNPSRMSEEEEFYKNTASREESHWSQNWSEIELRKELGLQVPILKDIAYVAKRCLKERSLLEVIICYKRVATRQLRRILKNL